MKKSLTFETAMTKLEEAVSLLESGDLPLDRALTAFEEAIGLVRFCQKEIEEAKQKVRVLTEQADGTVTESRFSESEGDE